MQIAEVGHVTRNVREIKSRFRIMIPQRDVEINKYKYIIITPWLMEPGGSMP